MGRGKPSWAIHISYLAIIIIIIFFFFFFFFFVVVVIIIIIIVFSVGTFVGSARDSIRDSRHGC